MNQLGKQVFEVAKSQCGVVAYWQLRMMGVAPRHQYRMLREGEWIRVLPSVARMYWSEPTWMQQAWAGMLWAGSTAALSHRSAAVLHGFDLATEDVEVTVARGTSVAPWLRVYRRRGVESVMLAGLRVTSPERTFVDLARSLDAAELATVWRQALRHRVVSASAVRQLVSGIGQGIAGIASVKRLVEQIPKGPS